MGGEKRGKAWESVPPQAGICDVMGSWWKQGSCGALCCCFPVGTPQLETAPLFSTNFNRMLLINCWWKFHFWLPPPWSLISQPRGLCPSPSTYCVPQQLPGLLWGHFSLSLILWQVKTRTPLCLGQGMFTESLRESDKVSESFWEKLEEFLVSLAKGERNWIVSTTVIQIGSIAWSDFTVLMFSFYMAPVAFLVSSNKWKGSSWKKTFHCTVCSANMAWFQSMYRYTHGVCFCPTCCTAVLET